MLYFYHSLRTYADHIGISYYLVAKLSSDFPKDEVEFYWPQYCHLLVTRPTESRALECYILRRCEEDVHVALLVRAPHLYRRCGTCRRT